MMHVKLNDLIIIFITVLYFILAGCSREDQKRNTVELIKTRTLGLAYIEENKLTEAESAFKSLIELAPMEALGYSNLGLVYFRMGDFEKAEMQYIKALEIEPKDPEIQLNYAEVLFLTAREKLAVELLEESIRYNPDHIRTLYKLGQNYSRSNDDQIRIRSEELLQKVVNFLPTNITARLELISVLLKSGKTDIAAGHVEQLKSQMPEFPHGSDEFYQKALKLMLANKSKEAIIPFSIFRNMLKPTDLFRVGFDDLKGVGGPLIGTPLITFRQNVNILNQSPQTVTEAIQFTDATMAAGLNILPTLSGDTSTKGLNFYKLALADFDGNGTLDLYTSSGNKTGKKSNQYLLKNNFGKYVDITSKSGIKHNGVEKSAVFIDYDNDGFLDLYLVNSEQNLLYNHFEPQRFRPVTADAGIAGKGSGNTACFADFDHDGDLDLYMANQSGNELFRNNLDGTFSDISIKMAVKGEETPSNDLAYGDFDDDGDIDLFVMNSESSNALYSNLRQGQFANVTTDFGLSEESGSTSLATGDYNNDGLIDLFISKSTDDGYSLYINQQGKKYIKDTRSTEMTNILTDYICSDIHFFDFDNDGFLDIVIAGKSKQDNISGQGLLLFHNNSEGIFTNVSNLLPKTLPNGIQVAIGDYNEDGDQDLFFSGEDGKVRLLRNDGGNANHYLKVQLVGLRTGSGKNNYFGIGAKLEVKSGELYQSHIVKEPISHFGLGQKTKADVVRVLWTNGVPQNLFEPGSDQALLEKQILKGSCPFLYTWNGEEYEFVTDVLWRSALGMPLGIMGGETAYGFANPSEDYFKIPGEKLKEKDGIYSLQLTAELWETAYFDQVKLLVVDHPDTTDIYIDERFTPPPFPPLRFYHVSEKKYPKSIVDDKGNDLSMVTRHQDDIFISDLDPQRYQGITKKHDVIIDLGNLTEKEPITLFLNGWVFPTDASINMAVSQSTADEILSPSLLVKDKLGNWKTVIDNISFPMGKNKSVILDLTDKFLSDNYQVLIRTTMQIYWDHIFYSMGENDNQQRIISLLPTSADIHYRGFSRMYRKGGRYGPFWFDYSDVSKDPKWRDLVGYYTRYGDVNDLLQESDSKYIITNAGDEITLEFESSSIPMLEEGWSRDFVIYTNGWLKDGDLNTAMGQTVKPLPFKGMSKYPYGDDEHYPTDPEYQQFLKDYITREVTTENYRNYLTN